VAKDYTISSKKYLHLMNIEDKKLICDGYKAEKVAALKADCTSGSSGGSTRGCTDYKICHLFFIGY
jgi:hypothetical protein